jgi:hypothetical protein
VLLREARIDPLVVFQFARRSGLCVGGRHSS